MTHEEARRLVQAFLQSQGLGNSEGLEGTGARELGGARFGKAQIYFEHDPQTGELKASALVYRFQDAPKPDLLEGFRQEEQAGTDTGGGRVDYEPESKGLYLSRRYPTLPPVPIFRVQVERLVRASRVWGEEVLDRVSTRAFHPAEMDQED